MSASCIIILSESERKPLQKRLGKIAKFEESLDGYLLNCPSLSNPKNESAVCISLGDYIHYDNDYGDDKDPRTKRKHDRLKKYSGFPELRIEYKRWDRLGSEWAIAIAQIVCKNFKAMCGGWDPNRA